MWKSACSKKEGRRVVEIRDQGIGIPQEEVELIFNLSIVLVIHVLARARHRAKPFFENYIYLHGGQMGIHSEEGHFTTVSITFPLSPAEEQITDKNSRNHSRPNRPVVRKERRGVSSLLYAAEIYRQDIKVVSVELWKIQASLPTKESGPYVVMASTINPRAPLPLNGFISAVGSAPTKSLSIPHSFTASVDAVNQIVHRT